MKKNPLKISAVSYLNTLPFLYGIKNYSQLKNYIFELDFPSICAKKLIDNKADIALIPVAAIPDVETPHLISDYCLGAKYKVKTVLLLSEVPLPEIKSILLDYQSRTSVNLVRILAAKLWEISPVWVNANPGFENNIKGSNAGVVIGDRAFYLRNKYPFVYDLSEEWYKLYKLPFVFATWVANKPVENEFISQFDNALKFGVENIDSVVEEYLKTHSDSEIDLKEYLTQNISFVLDQEKKKSMKLFFENLMEMKLIESNPLMKINLEE